MVRRSWLRIDLKQGYFVNRQDSLVSCLPIGRQVCSSIERHGSRITCASAVNEDMSQASPNYLELKSALSMTLPPITTCSMEL